MNPSSSEWIETQNPYSGETWARVPRSRTEDVNNAVNAAKNAFKDWSALKASERGKLLYRLADVIEKNHVHLAEIEVRDNGKLYAEMLGQTRYLPEWFRYYGGLADKVEGSVIPTDKKDIFNYTKYEPLGVCVAITAWNSPLLLLSWKISVALAAGNTVVIKPSEFTSTSTLEIMNCFEEAGIPKGVVNVVTGYGDEVGMPMVSHPDVAKISFTGSDYTGQKINEIAAKTFKKVTLELGGKSPNIVFDDADIESAVMGAVSGIFAATGQTCIAGSRLLLQESIHDQFVDRLVQVTKEAVKGDPMLAETDIGPVTTMPQYEKILDLIRIAKKEGAKCVIGGKAYNEGNHAGSQFIEPTIFTNVNNRMEIAQQEVFGPVLSVIKFDDEEEAIQIGNDVKFGLAAGIWTRDMGRALRVSDALQAGTVWVNTYRAVSYTSPFGGYKRSGLGRESGLEAIKQYMQVKSVWIAHRTHPNNPFVMR